MYLNYPRDIYNCTNCGNWVAHGDNYCKKCGYMFTTHDTEKMENNSTLLKRIKAPSSDLFFNLYNCIACKERISIGDLFCKHCGNKFTPHDVKVMRGDYKPNTVNTIKASVIFFVFILLVFAFLAKG